MSKIYINPGHGGTDSGAVGINGRMEKDDNLRYAAAVADKLCAAGHFINFERDGDYLISVGEIAKRANVWGADFFVSFHRNSFNGVAQGVECLIVSSASETSRIIAQEIQNRLVALGFVDRGIKVQDKRTQVLRDTHMPATTIECGFVDSADDNELFDSKFDEIVNAVTEGILAVAGSAQPIPEPTPQEPETPQEPASDIPELTRNLRRGDRGEDVRQAQERLNIHHAGAGAEDGIFGTRTKEAVMRFQQARKDEGRDIGGVDGIIGQKTWAILCE